MKIPVEELLERMERGEDIEQIRKSLISAPERELLKRCAAVRSFDQALVDGYFRPQVPGGGGEAIPFARLVSREFVEHVPRTEGTYRLTPSARQEYFQAWWQDERLPPASSAGAPAALGDFSRALAAHYRSLGRAGEIDLLLHQSAFDPAAARALFDRLYDEADAAFDLARCRDLINALRGRELALPAEFARHLREKDRYLQSRSLWAVEYYKTAKYLERDELNHAAADFLAPAGPEAGKWIMNLHAPGGRGKTMFLSWLVARRCVPEPRRLLCAKIDFDLVDRARAVQHPWLLVLHIARQLDAQTPDGHFRSLVNQLSEYESFLDHAPPPTPFAAAPAPMRPDMGSQFFDRFARAVNEASGPRPVVLILDTLEEIMLYYRERITAVMAEMEALHEASPNIRLILSGRYDLTDERQGFTEFVERYGEQTRSLEIKLFTEAESLSFLRTKMGLSDDRPLSAVARRSGGNPFKLYLFADLLRDDPSITEETVWSYPSVDLLYLIERVLIRLRNQQLHWLLRYGVVPRRLTLSFLKDVMQKYLLRVMSGDTLQDDPLRYEDLPRRAREKRILPTNLISEPTKGAIDLDALWHELRNFASSNAWVLPAAPTDTETIVFHGDVVNPMRRWLRGEPVYACLHEDAVRHFEGKALEESGQWAKWMAEAVYHRFQLEGARARAYWLRLIESEEATGNARWRRDLARELVGPEYVDENLQPRPHTASRPIVSRETLAVALYVSARAGMHMAREADAAAEAALYLSEAQVDLQKCEQVQAALPKAVVSAARIEAARAMIRASSPLTAEEAKLAYGLHLSPDERIDLLLAYSDVLARAGNFMEAQAHAREALALAQALKSGQSGQLLRVHRAIASYCRAMGDLEEAARWLDTARKFSKPDDKKTLNDLLMQAAEVHVEAGQYLRASGLAADVSLTGDESGLSILWLDTFMGRLHLALMNPVEALSFCRRTLESKADFDSLREPQKRYANELIGLAWEVQGAAFGELLDYDQARKSLESAWLQYRIVGDRAKGNRCLLRSVELLLTCLGDVKQADDLLNEAERLTLQTDPDEWAYQRLLKIRILHLSGREQQWRTVLKELQSQARMDNWPPHLRIKLLLEEARLNVPEGRAAADKLFQSVAELLGRVEPPSSRLALLDPLREYPTNLSVSPQLVIKLVKLVTESSGESHPLHRGLKLADLLRVAGASDSSRKTLRELTKQILKGESVFLMRDTLATWGKLGWRADEEQAVRECAKKFLEEFGDYPNLARAFLIDTAKLAADSDLIGLAAELLDDAEKLGFESVASQWAALMVEVREKIAARGGYKFVSKAGDASDLLEAAVGIYQGLNNSIAAGLLRATIAWRKAARAAEKLHEGGETETKPKELKEADAPPPATGSEAVVSIRLTAHPPYALTSEAHLPERKKPSRRQLKGPGEDGLLLDLLAYGSEQSYSYEFLKRLDADWHGTCLQLGEIILHEKDWHELWKSVNKPRKLFRRGDRADRMLDFRLSVDPLQLASVPWELLGFAEEPEGPASLSESIRFFYRFAAAGVSSARHETAWLQKALATATGGKGVADGRFGPQTAKQLEQFQREHGLAVTRVFDATTRRRLKAVARGSDKAARRRALVVLPSDEPQREVIAHNTNLVPIVYEEAGFDEVQTVKQPTPSQLDAILEEFAPDVIHACASVQESPSIGLYLDFSAPELSRPVSAPASGGGAADGLPVTAIDRLMRTVQVGAGTRAHFIVDVPSPGGRTELLSQLLTRNAFASQLFGFGNCASVIATGLSPVELELRHRSIKGLVGALTSDAGSGEAVNAVRNVAVIDPKARGWERFATPAEQLLETLIATAGTVLLTDEPRA